jgi:hypothetical protein
VVASLLQFDLAGIGWMLAWLAVTMLYAGYTLTRVGKQLFALTAQELMRRDPRPPILYLRSFSDEYTSIDPPERRLPDVSTIVTDSAKLDTSLEELLTRIFQSRGPVVAISTPDQGLPPPGAARMPLLGEENDWRAGVCDLIDRCSGILVLVGTSTGVLWEVEQVVARGALCKAWFVFAPDNLAERYASLRTVLVRIADVALPEAPPPELICLRFPNQDRPDYITGSPDYAGYEGIRNYLDKRA